MAIVNRAGYKGFEIIKKPLKLGFWMMLGCVPEQIAKEWHNPHHWRSLRKGFTNVSEQVLLILPGFAVREKYNGCIVYKVHGIHGL